MGTAADEHREVLAGGRPLDDRNHRGNCRSAILAASVAVVTGLVAGGAGVHVWDNQHHTSSTSAPAPAEGGLTFALGAQTGALEPQEGAKAVLSLSVVVTNGGSAPETVEAVGVSGPGASFVANPGGGPRTTLPQIVEPGRSTKIRFGIASDCSVAVRPLPKVAFVVRDAPHGIRTVAALIPDLDSLWGLTLVPPACGQT